MWIAGRPDGSLYAIWNIEAHMAGTCVLAQSWTSAVSHLLKPWDSWKWHRMGLHQSSSLHIESISSEAIQPQDHGQLPSGHRSNSIHLKTWLLTFYYAWLLQGTPLLGWFIYVLQEPLHTLHLDHFIGFRVCVCVFLFPFLQATKLQSHKCSARAVSGFI